MRSDVASHAQVPIPSYCTGTTPVLYLPWWEAATTNRSKLQRPLPFWAERGVGERCVLQVPRSASRCSRSGSSPDFSPAGAPCAPVGESSSSSDCDLDRFELEQQQAACKRAPHKDQWAALVRLS